MFTLGPEGKRLLEREGGASVVLERSLPKQREHLIGINDVRIAAERTPDLRYFFAAWELPGTGWQHTIVPDAIFRIGECTIALEYDRGLETLRYFVGSKIGTYRRGLLGLELAGILIVVDSEARRRTLARAVGQNDRVLIVLLDTIRTGNLSDYLERLVFSNCSRVRTGACAEAV